MERIKKAVEQAREARQEREGPVTGLGSRGTKAVVPREFAYTRTRSVPTNPDVLRRHRLVSGVEDDLTSTHYNFLRTRVLQRMIANKWQTLAITSPATGDGKSVTASNLAASVAREVKYTVLLADLDLRRSSVHRYFGFKPDVTLADYLRGDVDLDRTLVNPGIKGLVVVPGASEPVSNSSELLASPKMSHLVKELKRRYASRFVFFDLPPLLGSDDALAFLPNVDAVLLVVQDGKTTQDELLHCMDLLRDVPVAGTVLNKAPESAQSYYY